jgi:hypothetical protein
VRSSEEGSLCWRSFFNAIAAFLRAYILHEISLGSIPTLTLLVFPQESQDYGFNPLTIDDEQIDVVQLLAANIERLEEKIAEAEAEKASLVEEIQEMLPEETAPPERTPKRSTWELMTKQTSPMRMLCLTSKHRPIMLRCSGT